MSSNRVRIVAVALASALLIGLAGCGLLLTSNAASFTAGYLLGSATVNTQPQTTCYQNGVVIDCANVPAELRP